MDSPVIAILDQNETYLSKMDNSSSGAIHFFNETLHTYLQGSAYTFECSVVKDNDDVQHLQNGHKLSFREDDTDYQLSIIDIREDEKILKLIATGISLEMTKEHAGDYSAAEAMSFAQYLNVFDPEATITLNINEVSSKLLTLSWEGETTSRLSRLFSLANKFDAEIEFKTILKDDYSLDKLILNVYQKHDNSHQGIGQKREDIKLEYGVNVNTVSRYIDSSQVFTAIRATNHEGLDLVGWEYREYDENNRLLFESPKDSRNIYAPQARGRFPSNNQTNDRYTAYEWTYDTDNQEVLGGQALARLKEICEPTATYQIEGYFDLKLGDLVHVVDDGYTPTLLLSVRVSEQEISWTNPSMNRTTFTNVKVLESEVDTSLLAKVQALIEANKTYAYSISSTNGIVFKNNTGTTQLMATVKDGIREITEQFSIRWLKDGVTIFNGTHLTVAATDVEAKAIYAFEAINSDGSVIGGTEVTVIDVNDGEQGLSAYQQAAENGFTGTEQEWLESLEGQDGYTPIKGVDYFDGENGDPGPAGQNAITGYLTNESLIIPATATGSIVSLSNANGYFRVMDGNDQATSGITFSIESQTGVTVTLNSTGYYEVTGMSNDFGLAVLQAVYKGATITKQLIIVKSKQGPQGEDGPPTGVYVSSEVPPVNIRYVGMVWHNTGAPGYLINTRYLWNGSEFEIDVISANNIIADNLAALSAVLGKVTNRFTNIEYGTNIISGETTIDDADIRIKGSRDDTGVEFDNTLGPFGVSGGVYNPVLTDSYDEFYLLSSKGLRLHSLDLGSGFLSVEQLTLVEPTPIPLNSGFTAAENNTPLYRVTKRLDGSYQCELSGQVKLTSGKMLKTMRYYPGTLPVNARPLRNEFFQVSTSERSGGRLGTLYYYDSVNKGTLQLSPVEDSDYMALTCTYTCQGPLS